MKNIHRPLIPVRKSVFGEVVFVEIWTKINQSSFYEKDGSLVPFLYHILKPIVDIRRKDVTEREAVVAASFVKWLGTSIGSSFLEEMLETTEDQNIGSSEDRKEACANFWDKENSLYKNKNHRLIQVIVAKETDHQNGLSCVRYSRHDIDVIRCICRFLGSYSGIIFVEQCKDKIEAYVTRKAKRAIRKKGRNQAMRK